MKEFMKTIATLSLVSAGICLSDDTITSFISSALILVGGYFGGYLDGRKEGHKEGKRYMLGE